VGSFVGEPFVGELWLLANGLGLGEVGKEWDRFFFSPFFIQIWLHIFPEISFLPKDFNMH